MARPVRRLRHVAAAILCALSAAPASAQAVEVLPDLVADPPVDRGLQVTDGRLLLRFDAWIRNSGAGAVEFRGSNPQDGVLTVVKQRLYHDDHITPSDEIASQAVIRYENHVNHSHFHVQGAARYSLWTESRSFEVIGSEKAGFCFIDSERVEGLAPARYNNSAVNPEFTFCSTGQSEPSDDVVMGITSGWRDSYPYTLAFQWLDVSNLTPGRYRLGADVDPDNVVLESNEVNTVAFQDQVSIVPGYVARPQDLGVVNPFVPVQVFLGADAYARPNVALGPVSYEITKQPGCGSLAGTPPAVTYVPARVCKGTVAFEFSTRDSTSPFPQTPPTASVSLRLGSRDALRRPRVRRRGRRLRVRMSSRYAGTVRATALRKGRRLGSCKVEAAANRRVACTIRMKRRHRLRKIRIRTSLRIGGGVADKRRDRAIRAARAAPPRSVPPRPAAPRRGRPWPSPPPVLARPAGPQPRAPAAAR